jgi:hypothetical protein
MVNYTIILRHLQYILYMLYTFLYTDLNFYEHDGVLW